MKYTLRFTPAAQRQLRAVDRLDAMRILTSLTALGDDPRRADADIKRLAGPSGLYRLRVGAYRVAYRVQDDELLVLDVKVGGRRDAYRGL
ncbi:type II toxin-antitoxin system RelE family toxin [Streptomyces sp. MS19]|uniref:type II toxin-antitoxin system RelE family toxin n=1 Tax=Streptomyces sp. MS19 TaxID=3385972 RepID=UPI0039A01C68